MLIIGDMHTGVKAGNQLSMEIFHAYFASYLKDIFAYIDEHKIKDVVLLGDVFDVRKNLNSWAAEWFKKHFRDECVFRGLNVYVIVGNHDIFYRENLDINSPELMMGDLPDTFTLVNEPMEYNIGGMDCLLVPWICKQNEGAVLAAIKRSKADYLFGHFEFDGFEFNKGVAAKSHFKHEDFKKFKKIWSGHYHHGQMRDNVIYTGTPWELTWMDCDDPKGIYEFKDHKFEFIPNPHRIYSKVHYLENLPVSADDVTGKHVRVILQGRSDKKKFNKFMDDLYAMNPIDVKVEESFQEELASEIVIDKMKSTIQFLHDYIDQSDIELDKDKMKTVMDDLYQQAMMAQ